MGLLLEPTPPTADSIKDETPIDTKGPKASASEFGLATVQAKYPAPYQEPAGALVRVDQTQLERSIAQYLEKNPLPQQNLQIIKLLMVASWAVLIIGLYLIFNRVVSSNLSDSNVTASQNRSIAGLGAALNKQQSDVQDIKKDLAAASTKMTVEYDGIGQKTISEDRAIEKLTERLSKLEAQLQHRQSAAAPVPVHLQPVPAAAPAPAPKMPVDPNPPASLENPHIHAVDTSIPTVKGAYAHTNAMGQIDYWKIDHDGRTFRVQPFQILADGIRVHNIEDGRDYTITMSGEWLK